ncbi:EAL domain-containing protein [Quadrisphaera sp. INWT6]|nr:EAL domain-containing protein [Quadrisphaera sp. INWT6]
MNLHHALGQHHTAPGDVAPLTRPARIVAPDTACDLIDEAFRTDTDLTCLAVRPRPEDEKRRWGLISRGPFMSAMAGRLGYGRSVHARRPVSVLTDWDALSLGSETSVAQAAQQILTRDRASRYSEILVTDVRGTDEVPAAGSERDGACHEVVSFLEVEDVLRALAAELTHKALTDPLTQLANREHFLQQLHSACVPTAGPSSHVVVVYIDIDNFKAINDGYGHSTGDLVLQQVAQRLRTAVRPEDLVARLGGDEFAVLAQMPVSSHQPVAAWAHDIAQRLLMHLSEPMHVAGRTLPGQASIGVAIGAAAIGVDRPLEASVLLHEADLAMYGAKAAGGARCAVVDGTAAPAVTTALAPDRSELQDALDDGQFELHFQPIVDVLTGRLSSTEALVRWNHPARGLLSPVAFLGDVAAVGFAANLDVHVLHLALTQHARWRAEYGSGAPLHINVNLSVPGLLHPDLASMVLAELACVGLAPYVLRLELPEVATTAHIAAAAESLARLRGAGVGLTLDDVGSGAAGLAHLRDLHLDGIKIDRRFVAGMLSDERDLAVVRMLVQMGCELGVAVTAEGAETQAHLDALRQLASLGPGPGLHVQGYAIARPAPAGQVGASWLARAS